MNEAANIYHSLLVQMQERDRDKLAFLERWGPFEGYCWNRISPKKIISILNAPDEAVRGHKRIILAALCAWMSNPTDERLLHVKNAVSIEVGSVYAEIEQEILAKAHGNHAMAALAITYGNTAPLFVSHIYYAIGGLTALLESSSKEEYSAAHYDRSNGMRNIARLVAVYHYLVTRRMEGANLLPPSKLRAGKLFSSLNIGRPHWPLDGRDWPHLGLHERSVGRHDQIYLPATALIYAASRIRYRPNVTLLSAIIDNSVRYEALGDKLRAWLSMAAYTQREVLSYASERSYRKFDSFFDGIEPKSFLHPVDDLEDRSLIERNFTRKARNAQS